MTHILVKITPQMAAYLKQLLDTGLYGDKIEATARRLLEEKLQQLLQDELLERKDNP